VNAAIGAARTRRFQMARFMVSLIGDESWVEEATPKEIEQMLSEMNEFNDELKEAGVWDSADGLGPTSMAKTLRYGKDGKPVVTDGPFAESKEQIAGYWIFDCKDLDEAVEWVKRSPIRDGAVEIRPIPDSADENVELYKQRSEAS
jgi:hypothetical protein